MHKNGDRVELCQTIVGKYSDGKYKIRLGTNVFVDAEEKDLLPIVKKKGTDLAKPTAIITVGVMGLFSSLYFESFEPVLIFALIVLYIASISKK
jgi:hypothetical protein